MSVVSRMIGTAERVPLPDLVIRAAIQRLCSRTALDWLANFDAHRHEIEAILRGVYGNDTSVWMRRWRWCFLATTGLFGYAGGSEWGVSHYRMWAA